MHHAESFVPLVGALTEEQLVIQHALARDARVVYDWVRLYGEYRYGTMWAESNVQLDDGSIVHIQASDEVGGERDALVVYVSPSEHQPNTTHARYQMYDIGRLHSYEIVSPESRIVMAYCEHGYEYSGLRVDQTMTLGDVLVPAGALFSQIVQMVA